VSTVAIIGRMLLALIVVLAIMWALAKWARKPLGVGKSDKVMTVLARQQLSRTSSVAVLKLLDRALVLGVTEQGVQLLAETDLEAVESAITVEEPRRRHRTVEAEPGGLDEENRILPAAPSRRSSGSLDGSILSPGTWKQLVGAARDLTVRR
jgi:flagellar protein FliO/FliZ